MYTLFFNFELENNKLHALVKFDVLPKKNSKNLSGVVFSTQNYCFMHAR